MSEVLGVVRKAEGGGTPVLRLRCACGRVYQTKTSVAQALRLRSCIACCARRSRTNNPDGRNQHSTPKLPVSPNSGEDKDS